VIMSAGKATTGEEILTSEPYLSQIKYYASPSQNEAITALKNGIFDAIVIDYTIAKGSIANGNSDLMIIEGFTLQEEQYVIGFRLGSDMIKVINNLILDMIMDGTLADLAKKYNLVDLFLPIKTTDAGYIIDKGKLIIGFEGNTPPMTFYDEKGQLTGFDVELAKMVCKDLGIVPEFKVIDWNQKENDLKERNIDCIWNSLSVTEERRKNIKFSRVYMKNKLVVMIKKSSASYFTDLKSLTQAKISAEIGTTGEKVIFSNPYLSQANYIPSYSTDNALLELTNENFDAIVIDYTMAIGSINNSKMDLMILAEFDTNDDMYAVGFRINSDMTIKINHSLNKMINDGTLESLANKFGLIELYKLVVKTNEQSDSSYIISKGELIVGFDGDDCPPMTTYDEYGELTGFDTELAKSVCSMLGIDIVFKVIEWDKKEMELNNKNIDCVWNSLTVTEERRNYFEFSLVYLSNRQAVVIRRSDASKFPDTKSLSGAKTSAGISTTGEDTLLDDPHLSKSNYIPSLSQNDAISGLQNGQFDAIVIDFTLAKGVADSNGSNLMIVRGIKLQDEQYAVGFRVGSDMTQKVNDMIMDMILNDSITDLAKRYGLYDLFAPIRITDSDYIINKGKMIMGYDASLAPMAYYDTNGQLTGFDIEFAKAVCKQLGIEAEFKEIEWVKKENELKERNIDCVWSSLSVTEERREIFKFSRVYMNNKQVIVIRKSNIFKFVDLESLSESKISSKAGSLGEEAVITFFPNAEYKPFLSLNEMFTALQKGKIDAVIIDYTIAKYSINNGGFKDLIVIENINLMDDQYAIGFRYGSDITKKINSIINNMMSDGTLNAIAEKYDLLNLYTNKKQSSNNFTIAILLLILYSALILII